MKAIVTSATYQTDTGAQPALVSEPGGGRKPTGALLLVHENKGLTTYMRGVIEDLSEEGWTLLAPDLLARLPVDVDTEDATTRQIPMERHVADVRSALDALETRAGPLPVGMVGFCFGGEAALEAARGRRELSALVAWYGVPPPEASDLPDSVLLILAADDDRVNRPTQRFLRRMEEAGKDYVAQSYPGTLHAFHDWSRPERHSPEQAGTAWKECCKFLHEHLG